VDHPVSNTGRIQIPRIRVTQTCKEKKKLLEPCNAWDTSPLEIGVGRISPELLAFIATTTESGNSEKKGGRCCAAVYERKGTAT